MGIFEFCLCDYVEVRDGVNFSVCLFGIFCGINNMDVIYLSGWYFWVRFRLDDVVVDLGFVV